MKKQIFLFLLTLLLTISVFGQKRTTSVKGYTRKDGTYVRPHTRGYTPGSGSTSTYSYNVSTSNPKDKEIEPTSLKFLTETKTNASPDYLGSVKYKGQKIGLTTLKFIGGEPDIDNIDSKGRRTESAIVFYVSVLRYKGKTLDICPVPRDYSGWSFDKVEHKFDKKLISTEDALDLISNYDWRIYSDKIEKNFSYSFSDRGFPTYLTKTIEAIAVE